MLTRTLGSQEKRFDCFAMDKSWTPVSPFNNRVWMILTLCVSEISRGGCYSKAVVEMVGNIISKLPGSMSLWTSLTVGVSAE